MKSFGKYITQGIGLAIGIIIVVLVVLGVLYVKSGLDEAKLEKEQQRQDIINLHKRELEDMGLSFEEIENAINNGVDIEKDGTYKVKVISGKGDIVI